MKSIKFICPRCGKEFIKQSDYIIPGVEGFINCVTGFKEVVDPDKPYMCHECGEETIAQLYLSMEEA